MTRILVLGAGMVGVSAALELQSRGHEVVLADRRGPGEETSYGNAGMIQAEATEPYNIPQSPRVLLSYALGRSNDVVFDPTVLPRIAPILWTYFRNSAPGRHLAISGIYSQMVRTATADHAPFIAASGQEALIHKTGYVHAYRNPAGLAAAIGEAGRLARLYGVQSEIMDGVALRASEPALKTTLAGGIAWPEAWACTDPGALTAAYARLFAQRGGEVVRADASGLQPHGAGWRINGVGGPCDAEAVVIALGPWAPAVLARLGYRVRMLLKRGYHGHFASPMRLNRPLMDAESGVVLSPMSRGLRLATGAALVAPDAPARPVQLDRGARAVADMVDLGPRIQEEQWFGHRPCLPDMLPLIGAAPRHKGLWFDFGHGHQGFTLGPTSARLLADAMDGRQNPLLSALSPATRPQSLV
ncbi:MAG TPA: FAD-dependent oxidoreductase [Paenirhodobacter sp.]